MENGKRFVLYTLLSMANNSITMVICMKNIAVILWTKAFPKDAFSSVLSNANTPLLWKSVLYTTAYFKKWTCFFKVILMLVKGTRSPPEESCFKPTESWEWSFLLHIFSSWHLAEGWFSFKDNSGHHNHVETVNVISPLWIFLVVTLKEMHVHWQMVGLKYCSSISQNWETNGLFALF